MKLLRDTKVVEGMGRGGGEGGRKLPAVPGFADEDELDDSDLRSALLAHLAS